MDDLSLGSRDNQALGSGTQRKKKPTSRHLKENASGSLLSQSLDLAKWVYHKYYCAVKSILAIHNIYRTMNACTADLINIVTL